MPVATLDAFLSRLKGAAAPPAAVLVFGDEALFRDQALAAYSAAVSRGGGQPLVLTLHGPEGPRDPAPLELARFLDEARTASLFGERKLVILRRAQHFLKEHAAELASALRAIPKGNSVVLVSESSGKPPKALLDALPSVECQRPYDTPPPWAKGPAAGVTPAVQWAVERARAAGKAMPRDAAERLVSFVGGNCARLASEIEKLSLLAGERPGVTVADVDLLCGAARSETPYPFVDAVADGDARKALRLLASMFERGLQVGSGDSASVVSDATGIGAILVASLHGRFRDIGAAAEAARGGRLAPEAAAAEAGVKPFALKKVAADLRRHAGTDFARVFDEIVRADGGLKGESDSAEFVMERLVLALAGAAPAAVRR